MTTVDWASGTTTHNSNLKITPSSHDNMPPRTEIYPEGYKDGHRLYERGHDLASSLGGKNDENNVHPQAYDLNHGSYLSLEKAETAALQKGSKIESERIVSSTHGPNTVPEAYMVNDTITRPDGTKETFHFSATNINLDEMEDFEKSPGISDYWNMVNEYENPGDTLRASMSASDYGSLMEATDAELPTIGEDYEQADFPGLGGGIDTPEGGLADFPGLGGGIDTSEGGLADFPGLGGGIDTSEGSPDTGPNNDSGIDTEGGGGLDSSDDSGLDDP